MTATHAAQELSYEYVISVKISHISDFLWSVGQSVCQDCLSAHQSILFHYLLNSLLMKQQMTNTVVAGSSN